MEREDILSEIETFVWVFLFLAAFHPNMLKLANTPNF